MRFFIANLHHILEDGHPARPPFIPSRITDEYEDCLVGRLLHEAGEPFECLELGNPRAFDYDEWEVDKWA